MDDITVKGLVKAKRDLELRLQALISEELAGFKLRTGGYTAKSVDVQMERVTMIGSTWSEYWVCRVMVGVPLGGA